jgi:MFS transporter, DHA1 family, inner membrane transport protein
MGRDSGGAAGEPARRHSSAWAELALGLGGFGIGTGEFAIMGLLPDVASDLGASVPAAGHLISAYALGVVLGSPLIAMLAARAPRRGLLVALAACFAACNFASALSPDYGCLVAWRFLCGMPHGAYLGVAALTAASLVPAAERTRAIGRMMLGLTGATLLGVPLATSLGQAFGWRACFALVGSIGALTCLLILRWVPRAPAAADAGPLRELGALARRQVWLTLGVGSVGFGGLFAVVSYITPTLTELAGLAPRQVPLVLAVLGVGMILGNLVGSWLADRALTRTIGGLLIWNILVLSLFSLVVRSAWAAVPTVLLIGSGVALVPALQARLIDVAGDAQTLAAALNHSAFNIANALGAWLGGLVVTAGFGWASTGWVGVGLAVLGLAVFASSLAVPVASEGRRA